MRPLSSGNGTISKDFQTQLHVIRYSSTSRFERNYRNFAYFNIIRFVELVEENDKKSAATLLYISCFHLTVKAQYLLNLFEVNCRNATMSDYDFFPS